MAQEKHEQKSKVLKRSVVINGHKTSISLEGDFWTALGEIAATQNASIFVCYPAVRSRLLSAISREMSVHLS
jgi:predicted DNA-binding ribbon-helix-helix protein